MAHPLRLEILCILGGTTEVSVQDIVEQVGTSQSNISQHLSILREKGILASRKDANKVYYRIATRRFCNSSAPCAPLFVVPVRNEWNPSGQVLSVVRLPAVDT